MNTLILVFTILLFWCRFPLRSEEIELRHPKHKIEFIRERNEIRIRNICYFNSDGTLEKAIVDDGRSDDPEDQDGITERHMTKFEYIQEENGGCLVSKIEETYYDSECSEQKLLRRTENIYNDNGQLLEQRLYDSEGSFFQVHCFGYDREGRQILSAEQDKNLIKTQYDEKGRKTEVATWYNSGEETRIGYTYDDQDRIVKKEEYLCDGKIKSTGYLYDENGRKTAVIDQFGNTTNYHYDEEGRVKQILFPPVLNELDELIRPSISYTYDAQGRVVGITDPNGFETKTTYTHCDKPEKIEYPDGTTECYEYNQQGEVIFHHSRTGCKTIHERDYLNRIIRTEKYSAEDELDSCIQNTYNAFHILSSTDSSGSTTMYHYDQAGRQTAIEKTQENNVRKLEYTYNTLGQITLIKERPQENEEEFFYSPSQKSAEKNQIECFRENPDFKTEEIEGFVNGRGQFVRQVSITDDTGFITVTTMDALERIEKIVRKSPYGYAISQLDMRYDPTGNKVKETFTIFRNDSPPTSETTSWRYGPCNRVEEIIQMPGTNQQKRSTFHYNDYGLLTTTVLPDGTVHQREYDTCGRLLQISSSDGSFTFKYSLDETGKLQSLQGVTDECDNSYKLPSTENEPEREPYNLENTSFWSETWKSLYKAASASWEKISKKAGGVFQYLNFEVSALNFLAQQTEAVAEVLVGRNFLNLVGLHPHGIINGTFQGREVSDKVRVTLINGILNLRSDHIDILNLISQSHGGCQIHYVFRANYGWSLDMIRCFMSKMGYISMEARMLAELWKKLLKEMEESENGGAIVHYAHSIGGTETINARSLMSPEAQNKIRVITIGSPTMVDNKGFQSVVNYVSKRDGVCLLDPINYIKGIITDTTNIVFIGSALGIPFVEHTLSTKTYMDLISMLGRQFMEMFCVDFLPDPHPA